MIFNLIGFSGGAASPASAQAGENSGAQFHKKLPPEKRGEIRILDEFTVEIGLGPDNDNVSSNIRDALRSIPVVDNDNMPPEALVRGQPIYKQPGGNYTWDPTGRKPVRLTSKDIQQNGNILVSVPFQETSPQTLLKPGPPKSPSPSPPASLEPADETRASPKEEKKKRNRANITGFRSARFGMTQKKVLEAIGKDFGIEPDSVQKRKNIHEKTDTLVVTVPDLIPGSGPAGVIYIFGYQTKLLTQVNLFWGKPFNPKPKPEAIRGVARRLQGIFSQRGFPKDSIKMNVPLSKDILLVFNGSDKKGRMVEMVLNRPSNPAEGGDSEKIQPKDYSLRLSYIEDPGNPDLYRSNIQADDF